jgi:two-component system NtrC family sensor kinase
MSTAERSPRTAVALRRVSRSVGAKLFTTLFSVLLLNLGLLGWVNVQLHRRHLESARLASAQQMSDVIRRSTVYYMLRNDRSALSHIVQTIGQQPGMTRLRIYDARGRIGFSTDEGEVGRTVTPMPAASHIRVENGTRVLGITTPIPNAPSCATAACHAHAPTEAILGMLDTNLSLASADAEVRASTWRFIFFSGVAMLLTLAASAAFVWRFVQKPVTALREGTKLIGGGDLGVQIPVNSRDELGSLAVSFNQMSRQLLEARQEIEAFARSLEDRVRSKTAELQGAHEQMLRAEKLTSLGKLAAVVAHEVNNPLSGILTYAKLMRRWVERGDSMELRGDEMRESLQLIESESKRCGELVRNLLTFARVTPLNIAAVDFNQVVHQCIRLVQHKLELGSITADLQLDPDLPPVRGDANQLEQLLLALVMNAIEAMPHEGTLTIVTTASPKREHVIVTIEDDGTGIAPEVLSRLFDPFVTTKEGKGVGLGLAISRSIVERHEGQISVASEPGRGTRFTITLPVAQGLLPASGEKVAEGRMRGSAVKTEEVLT